MSGINYSMYLIKEPFRVTGGFYVDGKFNSLVCVDGKSYRRRVEILPLCGNKIWLNRKGKTYTVPGGDCERNTPDAIQLMNDCMKDIGSYPNHITYKLTYKIDFDEVTNPRPKWMNQLPILYDGIVYTVYLGTYDQLPSIENWYPITSIKSILRDPHLRAIKNPRR